MERHFLITGGAGYIGSLLTSVLLARGDRVTVLDNLLHGGDSILGFLPMPGYRFRLAEVTDLQALKSCLEGVDTVVHLAALVGFPACDRAGREATWRTNVEGTRLVRDLSREAEVERLLFASSYSNYGLAPDGSPVTEGSPLLPQSAYAESKVEAESLLLEESSRPAVTALRLATVFGVSPRTRFDLMVNEFALAAHRGEKLVIYQKDFQRTFVHVSDVVRAVVLIADANPDKVGGQIFNIGGDGLNSSKKELIALVKERWQDLEVEERDLEFAGDMRSLHVSFEKVKKTLGFEPQISLRQGLVELHRALSQRLLVQPEATRHRNHPALLA